MHAQTVEAAEWWARPRGEATGSWVANYRESLAKRHRDVIVDIVRDLGPVSSVLEVGSHCGPNLIRLAQALPEIEQLTGIDVNADAVAAGNAWAATEGYGERIQMVAGRVPEHTSPLPDGCVDVVLSCYALAYIAPADLDATLYEMGRLARVAVILAEPMRQDGKPSSARQTVSGYHEWDHDYINALRWVGTLRSAGQSIVAIDPPVDALASAVVLRK